jgi:N-acyl-phosphatidylethanolamine-hydrolysing phospholipase D
MLGRRAQGVDPVSIAPRTYPTQPVPPRAMRVVWIGHSSLLVEFGGGPRVLIDPVFSATCSPIPGIGPRRFHAPGIGLGDLPHVDAVLVSHNHYDHLDAPSIRHLVKRSGGAQLFVVPLGLGSWFHARGARNVRELDWWEENQVGVGRVLATPAQHWSKRGFADTNRSLWCGFRIDSGPRSFYYAGDSGYFAGYAEVAQRLGPVELAALPIGAYEPRWFMKVAHQSPEEAVQAYRELRAQSFLAVHHNTFRLTDEPPDEPARRLRVAWERAGYSPSKLWIPDPGEFAVFEG